VQQVGSTAQTQLVTPSSAQPGDELVWQQLLGGVAHLPQERPFTTVTQNESQVPLQQVGSPLQTQLSMAGSLQPPPTALALQQSPLHIPQERLITSATQTSSQMPLQQRGSPLQTHD